MEEIDDFIGNWKYILPFDVGAQKCSNCSKEFTKIHLPQHCKHCGRACCGDCLQEVEFANKEKKPVCNTCQSVLNKFPSPLCEYHSIVEKASEVTKNHSEHYFPQESKSSVTAPVPGLHFLVTLTGSRGDIQPFIALGIKMKEYGHTITIATHKCFREFVIEHDLLFYPLPGDPKDLMDLMVSDFNIELVREKFPKHRE